MKVQLLEREQVVPASPAEAFAFFCDAHNLEAITPPFLRFRVVTPKPIAMHEGTRIEYRLRLHGVPIRWLTRIEEWNPSTPSRRFVDRQFRGPYALWHHTHVFESHHGGTLMRDRVRYALPLGPLGEAAHALFVARDLRRIFDFRHDEIRRRIAGP